MTESSHDVFVDRRTDDQREAGLATHILFWYDHDKKHRRRVNGVAVTTDGYLLVARATCSKKDQFVKSHGRFIIERRMSGRAKKHHWMLLPLTTSDELMSEACADVYRNEFPADEMGIKRAFNAGRVFARYQADLDRRANEIDEL
jgi:hypothetical protein